MNDKIAVVTGASSGIGWQLCLQLMELGYKVYGCSRRGTVPEGACGISMDVTDEQSVKNAFDFIVKKEGRLDLLINNAGFGLSGPVEFTKTEDFRQQMDVNFTGQFLCTKEVLPLMRRQKSGRIIFTGSVAGTIAIPFQAFYSTSKAAVCSMACALRNEVKEFGISVYCMLPGDAATGFTDARKKSIEESGVYIHSQSAVNAMEKDERSGMTPEYVARKVIKTLGRKNPPPMITIGNSYKLLMLLFKLLPARLAYFIVGKMYS